MQAILHNDLQTCWSCCKRGQLAFTSSGASASTISILSTNGGLSDPGLHFSPLLDSNSPFCQNFFIFLDKIIRFLWSCEISNHDLICHPSFGLCSARLNYDLPNFPVRKLQTTHALPGYAWRNMPGTLINWILLHHEHVIGICLNVYKNEPFLS